MTKSSASSTEEPPTMDTAIKSINEPPVPEEESILSFIRRYLGLLAAIGSAPLLANGLSALPAPEGAVKLVGAASLISVAALAICLMLRDVLDDWLYKREWYKRTIPALIATALLTLGIVATVFYSGAGGGAEGNVLDKAVRAACYLWMWAFYSSALGVAVVSTYSLFYGSVIQQKIDALILGREDRRLVNALLAGLGSILRGQRGSPSGNKLTQKVARDLINELIDLSRGQLVAVNQDILDLQRDLLSNFGTQLETVSDRDMRFWMRSIDQDDASSSNRLSREYFNLHCSLALKRPVNQRFTRIFIITDDDIETNLSALREVLSRHTRSKIGWAIAFFDELSPDLRSSEKTLAFALVADGEAICFYSNLQGGGIRMTVVLADGEDSTVTKEYRDRHSALEGQCWLCSEDFLSATPENSPPKLERESLGNAIEGSLNDKNIYRKPDNKIVVVQSDEKLDELSKGLHFIRQQRRKNRAFSMEFASSYVKDLAGRWDYQFSGGVENEGGKVVLGGECEFVIAGRTLRIIGVRRQASGLSFGESNRLVRWQSSPIQFQQREGKEVAEVTYRMTSEEGDASVTCVVENAEEKVINGEMALYMRGKVIRGRITFTQIIS